MRAVGWTATAIAALAAPQVLAAETGSQASLDRLDDTLGYQYAMVDTGPECTAGIDGCFLSTITLTMPANLPAARSEEHTSELQSLMRTSHAVFGSTKEKSLT